eukprot:980734-Prorocentrum_minimum.AAC.1
MRLPSRPSSLPLPLPPSNLRRLSAEESHPLPPRLTPTRLPPRRLLEDILNDIGPDDADKERMLHRGGQAAPHPVFSRQQSAPANPFASSASHKPQGEALKSLFAPQAAATKKPSSA